MAEAAGHGEVVGHKDQGEPQVPLQGPKQAQHLGLHLRIEHADALVADQHLGVQRQGPGNGHPLLLTA